MSNIYVKETKGKAKSYGIQFNWNKKRYSLSFSKHYLKKDVQVIQTMIDHMIRCDITGDDLPPFVKEWIDTISNDTRQRLERIGLLTKNKRITVSELWDQYYADQEKVNKFSTLQTYDMAKKRFLRFFDPNINPNDIREEDGKAWRKKLTEQYAEATVASSIQRTRAVFTWGVRNGYLKENVFCNIPRGSFINKDKEHYVSMSDYKRLLDACPDQEWRTLLALCRIGGLRNPSETLMVKWTDVNWEMNRLLVHSPKTEHHAGKDSRIIPLFPELRKELEIQFDQAREGAVFIIDHWRDVDKNLRTHFERIIFRAGLEKWDRLFHNLRGSRSNELFSDFPSHVASTWMGQNSRVALEHYLHPREEDFQKAMEEPSISDKEKPSKKAGSPNPIIRQEERVFY